MNAEPDFKMRVVRKLRHLSEDKTAMNGLIRKPTGGMEHAYIASMMV